MSQEAWLNAKGISSIWPPCPEKTSKMWSDFGVLGQRQNIPIFQHVLDVFSWPGDRIELIPFAFSQASWDTGLDYPHGAFWRENFSNYSAPLPLLGEPGKNDSGEKNTFPIDLITWLWKTLNFIKVIICICI